ncbi:MAG: hypothetical protein ABL934_14765 [Lysobacteraceae bacterium]
MNDQDTPPKLASGLPPPPIPKEWFESLVIDYIETHKEELQLTTLNYESPVGIGLKK